MKNLKKVLALVVALTMVLGTVAFAAFTDVAVEDDEYTAVSTLSSLEILNGYDDGSFKPDGDITRAEFCAVVCRALGYEPAAGATMFTDVPADHWAAGYINTCAGAKIVNGMGDGTFAPNANVTYEQAVKMLVVALGYEPMAAQKGGYPTGYMVVANTYGMTKGISVASQAAAASRGVVAQLTYNALDIPMMEQTGFGTNTEFTILDGTNNKDYKTLLTNLDVAKLEGSVIGTSKYGGEVAADEVEFRVKEANDNEYFEDKLDGEDYYDATLEVAEGVNVDDYFGVASIVYAKEVKKNTYEIIAIMPGEDSEIVELDIEDIEEVTEDAIEYYASASATKTSKYKLDDEYTMFVNYAEGADFAAFVADAQAANNDVEITLIENSGDNKFDIIVIKEYAYDRVDTIEEDDTAFTSVAGEDFVFDFEDEELDISLVNKDGDAIEFADIKENDVFAYISDKDAADFDTWIEVIVLGESAVTGAVDEVKTDAIYVDGTKYVSVADSTIKLGDEGTFYLTRTGKIFDFDKDASVASNYAIVLDAGQSGDDFGEGYQVKLLTKNNEVIIYSLRDNLLGTETQTKLEALETNTGDKLADDVANRLVTFKLDSKNNIRDIEFITVYKLNKTGDELVKVEYDADAESLGQSTPAQDTVVFNVSAASIDSAFATNVSALVNEGEYAGYYVNNEDDDETEAIIIVDGGSLIDFTQDIAVVAETTEISINEGADEAIKVRYYVSEEDELKEIILSSDTDVTAQEGDVAYDEIEVGDAFLFTAGSDGVAAAFGVIGEYANGAYTKTAFAEEIEAEDDDIVFFADYIDTLESVNAGRKIVSGAGEVLTVKGAANQYRFEKRGSKTIINVGSFKSAEVKEANDDGVNCFFAKKVKNTVTDIISVTDKIEIVIG